MIKNKTPKNIFLMGFMGAGKTTVGKILAKRLRLTFIDLDEVIEKELNLTIQEIFSRYGEDFFRDAETKALRSIADKDRYVVATGGGVVLRKENWQIMIANGITVYLRAPAEVLWTRVRNNTSRPLLQVENPFERLCELFTQRIPQYEKADLIVDTENVSPEDVAEEIIKK
ncbi:MAG: shikimate kinase, shikimate kinase [Candidatus Dadabacteria bacterium CSP1-2]|nr:MAG: shikimate kinase, shikimate kinase [Candidatus Dadabacteria bacterium CSP1-2]MBF8302740.1 aroK [Candidatus Dadabacteria bacterium]